MPESSRPLWPAALTFCCSILGAMGQAFFKTASEKVTLTDPLTWIGNVKLIVGLAFYGLATVLFVFALKHGNLSLLYPIIAMSYVWVMLISVFYFKEDVVALNWLGIGLIILGVALTQR